MLYCNMQMDIDSECTVILERTWAYVYKVGFYPVTNSGNSPV